MSSIVYEFQIQRCISTEFTLLNGRVAGRHYAHMLQNYAANAKYTLAHTVNEIHDKVKLLIN